MNVAGGVSRQKKYSSKTGITPMVDPGFLLITLFGITTELIKPVTTDLIMPKEGPDLPLGKSYVLTVLLGKNNTFYYYHDDWKDALKANKPFQTNFSAKRGMAKVLREKQQRLDIAIPRKEEMA